MTHDLDRPAQTLREFPLALHDTSATNRVFRRDFWNIDVGGFPHSADGEAFAIVRATLQARRFDFLQTISCIQHARLDPATLLPAPPTASELAPASTGTGRPGAWCATPSIRGSPATGWEG